MFAKRIFSLAALALLACSFGTASAQVGVSIGIGGPYYRGGYYRPYPYYYGPRVYVAPPPIVVGAPPPGYVVVPQQQVVVQPAPQVVAYPPGTPYTVAPPPPSPVPAPAPR